MNSKSCVDNVGAVVVSTSSSPFVRACLSLTLNLLLPNVAPSSATASSFAVASTVPFGAFAAPPLFSSFLPDASSLSPLPRDTVQDHAFKYNSLSAWLRPRASAPPPPPSTVSLSTTPSIVTTSPGAHESVSAPRNSQSINLGTRPSSLITPSSAISCIRTRCESAHSTLLNSCTNFFPRHRSVEHTNGGRYFPSLNVHLDRS